jgi:glucosamine 6-phosphate synthetase-like amidotransferase/phosphosugar isomerase protein
MAKEKGIKTLGIVNVVGSSIAREADNVFYTLAGPEISVATTKAYSTQLVAAYLLALQFAKVREEIDDDKILSVGLQSYHFKNMEDIFGISEDEVKKNAPCKVLATSSMDVLDENLNGKELVTIPVDERWIILT